MTANDWILPWFILVRIMYIMLNNHSHYASYVDSKVSLSVEALLAA